MTRETPVEQGFHCFRVFGFWLLQGQRDRCTEEFESSALGRSGFGQGGHGGAGVVVSVAGDSAGARAAYQIAVDSGRAEQAPMAAFDLGLLLAGRGDLAGARAAYQIAIDSGHAEYAPKAATNLRLLLDE